MAWLPPHRKIAPCELCLAKSDRDGRRWLAPPVIAPANVLDGHFAQRGWQSRSQQRQSVVSDPGVVTQAQDAQLPGSKPALAAPQPEAPR